MAIINGRGIWGVRPLIPNIITTTSNWTRPTDWLALNAPTDNTEQFTGLLAITNDDGNYVTLLAQTTGNYTVDWGDGTVTTHAPNTVAEKKYEYSAISESTLCSRGYKQVVVKLTGTNVTQFLTIRPHSAIASTATNVLATWLEYHINLPNCTFLRFNRTSYTNGAFQSWVEKITINKLGSQTSFGLLFNALYSLQEVVINATTTSVTDTVSMFSECFYLKSVPLFDTSNVTNISNMFSSCFSLETIPSFNFGSVVTANSVFTNCYSINNIPTLNLGNATSLYGFFQGCTNLTTIAGLTTTKCQEFSFMFTGCHTLETVPLFDTSKATAMGNMFSSCRLLTEIPAFDTSLVTQFGNTFLACNSLKSIPLLNTVKGITFTQMFAQCQSLDELPALNLTAGTTFTNMFSGANGIAKAPFVNIKLSFSFANMMLSRTAIVDIFNGLASGVTSKTITVSNNPGSTAQFLTLNQGPGVTVNGWAGISSDSSGNIYAVQYGGPTVYKQTAGTGNFAVHSGGGLSGWVRSVCAAPNGNIYVVAGGNTGGRTGPIFVQTGGTGSFTNTSEPQRAYMDVASTTTNNIYAIVFNGDIYMQTGGTGAFNALGQTSRAWSSVACAANGDVYTTVYNGDIYKQTGGTGAFTALGQTSRAWIGITVSPNGDIYAAVDNGDIYVRIGGVGTFTALGQTSRSWRDICAAPNGNIYGTVESVDIFKQTNTDVLTAADRLIATNKGWTVVA
jgi:hypothetical protein